MHGVWLSILTMLGAPMIDLAFCMYHVSYRLSVCCHKFDTG